MSPAEREALIAQYAEGPERLERALAQVPEEALKWRPAPGKWSVHEIVVHCADSETNAHMRLRYLVGEDHTTIIGYDQDGWTRIFDYHSHPLEPALVTVRAVRLNTLPLLRRLTEAQWTRMGSHTESGAFGVEDWLEVYGIHLHQHERQVLRNLDGWAGSLESGV